MTLLNQGLFKYNLRQLFSRKEGQKMAIKLNQIIRIDSSEFRDWSICLNNAPNEGIYSFEDNRDRLLEHISWKKGSDSKMSFRNIYTKYCLQFIRLDKDLKWDNWLFLGAFENKGVKTFEDGHEVYDLHPIERFSEFRDRLVVYYKKKQGPKQAKLDISHIESIEVEQILEKPYIQTMRPFPGYNNVSLPFSELNSVNL